MRALQKPGQGELNKVATVAAPEMQGLAGWAFSLLRSWRAHREMEQRQLRVVETLPLGGKRQLMLVTCGGERFLVGGGPESVETIIRLKAKGSPDVVAKNLDGPCR